MPRNYQSSSKGNTTTKPVKDPQVLIDRSYGRGPGDPEIAWIAPNTENGWHGHRRSLVVRSNPSARDGSRGCFRTGHPVTEVNVSFRSVFGSWVRDLACGELAAVVSDEGTDHLDGVAVQIRIGGYTDRISVPMLGHKPLGRYPPWTRVRVEASKPIPRSGNVPGDFVNSSGRIVVPAPSGIVHGPSAYKQPCEWVFLVSAIEHLIGVAHAEQEAKQL
jgi:hypothetical protein